MQRILNLNIDCTMEAVPLQDCTPFAALSYTWGLPVMDKVIWINGQSVSITKNLWEAILRLRKDDQPVTIWADAICINQKDDSEKSQQVCLMRLIYEKASSVMVWLGPAANESEILMTALNDLGKQALDAGILRVYGKEFQKIFKILGDADLTSEQQVIKDSVMRISDSLGLTFPFRALHHFTSRPYWNRVWIFQEITVASEVTVLCGEQEISFQHLAAARIFLFVHTTAIFPKLGWKDYIDPVKGPLIRAMVSATDDDGIPKLIGSRRRYHLEIGSRETLFELLTKTLVAKDVRSDQMATDLRDIIYGVAGMASDFAKLALIPDYKKSIQDVFTDATKCLLRQGYGRVLAWSQQPNNLKRLSGLPTWVPDFSNQILSPCNGTNYFEHFSASGKHRYASRASPIVSSHGANILALSCYKVDTVEQVGTDCWHGENYFDIVAFAAYLNSIEKLCESRALRQAINPGCVVTADWAEAAWRIPSGDQEQYGNRRGTEAMHRDLKELREYGNSLGPGQFNHTDLSTSCSTYCYSLSRQHNRRPFLSSMGYLGLVPAQSEREDVVCIVEGAAMPFVFRKFGEFYKLVGEAYVYGIMDGEFMESGPPMEILHVF